MSDLFDPARPRSAREAALFLQAQQSGAAQECPRCLSLLEGELQQVHDQKCPQHPPPLDWLSKDSSLSSGSVVVQDLTTPPFPDSKLLRFDCASLTSPTLSDKTALGLSVDVQRVLRWLEDVLASNDGWAFHRQLPALTAELKARGTAAPGVALDPSRAQELWVLLVRSHVACAVLVDGVLPSAPVRSSCTAALPRAAKQSTLSFARSSPSSTPSPTTSSSLSPAAATATPPAASTSAAAAATPASVLFGIAKIATHWYYRSSQSRGHKGSSGGNHSSAQSSWLSQQRSLACHVLTSILAHRAAGPGARSHVSCGCSPMASGSSSPQSLAAAAAFPRCCSARVAFSSTTQRGSRLAARFAGTAAADSKSTQYWTYTTAH